MKKKLCALIVSLLPIVSQAQAMEIDCWSGRQNIYHGIGVEVTYGDGFLFFKEKSTGRMIYVSSDCVVKYYKSNRHK